MSQTTTDTETTELREQTRFLLKDMDDEAAANVEAMLRRAGVQETVIYHKGP